MTSRRRRPALLFVWLVVLAAVAAFAGVVLVGAGHALVGALFLLFLVAAAALTFPDPGDQL